MTPPRRRVYGKIDLTISGPKYLLRENVLITADLHQTWLDLLREDLKLNIGNGEGFFVCSSHYCLSLPKPGQGWRAEISDKILHFVLNFMQKRKRYFVRLCNEIDLPLPQPPPAYQRSTLSLPSSSRRTTPSDIRGRPTNVVTPQGPVRPGTPFFGRIAQNCDAGNIAIRDTTGVFLKPRPPARRSTPGGKEKRPEAAVGGREGSLYSDVVKRDLAAAEGNPVKRLRTQSDPPRVDATFRIPVISNVASAPPVEVAIPPSILEAALGTCSPKEETDDTARVTLGAVKPTTSVPPMPIEDNVDNVSIITAASAEGEELRQLGIRPENVKPRAERRLNGISNSFLLRLRAEHRRLQANGTLMRNAGRAPLACFLVQELFRE